LAPNQPAHADRSKIVKSQCEFQRQNFQTLQPNVGARICDIANSRGIYADAFVENSCALAIFVLPIAVRSLISAIGMLNELLVDPTVSIVATPHLAADEAPRYRSPRDNHGP
jgi:hypothetical protein